MAEQGHGAPRRPGTQGPVTPPLFVPKYIKNKKALFIGIGVVLFVLGLLAVVLS